MSCPKPSAAMQRMHSSLRAVYGLWSVVGVLFTGLCVHCPDEARANEVLAGAAQAQFTLPRNIPLAGYSKRKGRSSIGVHDPVGVRALVLQDAHASVMVASCDLLIIDEHLFNAVRHRLIERGVSTQAILLLQATHTHSGPGAYGARFLEKISMGRFDPAVFDELVRTIAETILRARTQLQPVRVAYGTEDTQGLVQNRMDPSGLVVSQLTALAFYRPTQQTPFAVVVSFSAHPITLGAWNRYLSGDYPGVLVKEIEQRLPGAVCLFLAGSVGDQAPVKAGLGFERAAWMGQTLAQDTSRLLERMEPVSPNSLRAWQDIVPLPPAKARLRKDLSLPHWLSARLVEERATLSLVKIDQTVLFGLPCDVSSELGRELAEAAQSRGFHPMVVSFSNDYMGYCLTEARYRSGAYEALMAFNGPHAGSFLVDRLVHALDHVDE